MVGPAGEVARTGVKLHVVAVAQREGVAVRSLAGEAAPERRVMRIARRRSAHDARTKRYSVEMLGGRTRSTGGLIPAATIAS